jgi:uncharacterized protein (TIGR00290 family)
VVYGPRGLSPVSPDWPEMADEQAVVVSWSGGKDGCMALHEIRKSGRYRVEALISTVTEGYERVSMHGVRRSLLERQAKVLGLPLQQIRLSQRATNEEYETKLAAALALYRERGVREVVFGDLFLQDIREYREQLLAEIGMRGLFPVWNRDTDKLVRHFIGLGFKAVVTCANAKVLDGSFTGMMVDGDLLNSLPEGVDPCGENGEFHTFVFDGPCFEREVEFEAGEVVLRDGYFYRELLPL